MAGTGIAVADHFSTRRIAVNALKRPSATQPPADNSPPMHVLSVCGFKFQTDAERMQFERLSVYCDYKLHSSVVLLHCDC